MILDSQEIKSLLNGNLILDFAEIQLFYASNQDVPFYSGSGSVYQTQEGELELKIYHVFKSQEEQSRELRYLNNASNLTPGKILDESNYFSMVGKDMKGREWTAEHIHINPSFNFADIGKTIVTRLHSIKTSEVTKANGDKNWLTAFFYGGYELPYNKYETTKHSSSLSNCEFSVKDFACTFKKLEHNLQLNLILNNSEAFNSFQLVIEAVQIASGQYMTPFYLCFQERNVNTTIIKKRSLEKARLPAPIPIKSLVDIKFLQEFVAKYLTKFEAPYNPYYGHWRRINGAYSGVLENRSLVITTAIEGILKTYYKEFGKPDDEFLNEIDKALPAIESIKIGERVKNRLVTTLKNAKDITAKNALRGLEEEKLITNLMLKAWEKSRNKAVHPTDHELKDSEIQKMFDDSFCCLGLFYGLLMSTIEYSNTYIDYSKLGWPSASFRKC